MPPVLERGGAVNGEVKTLTCHDASGLIVKIPVKVEIEEQVKEKIDIYGIDGLDVDTSNNEFKVKFIKVLKKFFMYILLPLILNTIYDLGKAAARSLIKSDTDEKAVVIYEITNQETYINLNYS